MEEAQAPPAAAAAPADAAHLLVVDDDARLRALLQRFLSEQGFRVSTAADAAAARASLAAVAFDLVVLDVMMPGESGLELAESLRRQGREVPILMLTALDATEDKVEGLRGGADDYLTKPFDFDELLARIVPDDPNEDEQTANERFEAAYDFAIEELSNAGPLPVADIAHVTGPVDRKSVR